MHLSQAQIGIKMFSQRAAVRQLLIGLLLLLPFSQFAFAAGDNELQKTLSVQREIETAIKSIIGSQLSEGEYFVYAKVKLKADTTETTGQSGKLDELVALPYSPLKVEKQLLQDMFRKSRGETPEVAEMDVTIVFDTRVPKEKVELLSGVISDRFGFNGQDRRLAVKTLQLVTEPVKQAEKLVFEKSKLDSEKALLELEQARAKLEMAKREAELEAAKRLIEEQQKTKPADPTAASTAIPATQVVNNQQQPKGVLDYLQGFQVLLLAIISGVFAIVLIFLASSTLKKGLQPMAEAVNRIGEGFGKMAPAAASTAAVAAGPAAAVTTTSAASGTVGEVHAHIDKGDAAMAAAIRADRGPEDKGLEEFLQQITDKIKVLMSEKNFSFYRHFLDMVESEQYRKMAAAILLTIDEKEARTLLSSLSSEHIDKLKDYLTRPGAMLEARSINKVALQEFYGRIAAEEFSGSPLYKLSKLDWFTQMSTVAMTEFVLSLDPELRAAFLACLSPSRVAALITTTKDKARKDELIKTLKTVDAVTEKQIEVAMEKISKLAPTTTTDDADGKPMVNSARYIAQIAETMSAEDRATLLGDLESNKELVKRLREHMIPFSAVKALPKEMVTEIFASRGDLQIAQILFDASQDIRDKVLGVLPEIRKENVRSELQVLDDNKLYAKRNRRTSSDMQKEITRYLLALYREGLLELDEDVLAANKVDGDDTSSAA